MKKRSKTISVTQAIDRYYKMRKSQLDEIFGGEKQAKAQLENMPGIPANRFNSRANATRAFDDFLESQADPYGHDLRHAKQDALENTPGFFNKVQQLNKRIDKHGFIPLSKRLGVVDGKTTELDGYYEIANSDAILASVTYTSGKNTQITRWEFLDKDVL